MSRHPAVEAFRGGPGVIRVIGHRGARGVLPENTMMGFAFAFDIGVPLLEFDVVMTADRVPVITHNTRLHAPTFRGSDGRFLTGTGPRVAELTWADIQRFDVGRLDGTSDYGKRFPDQAQIDGLGVPRLIDLLALAARPEHADAHLMLELKSDPALAGDTGYRAAMVGKVIAEVRAAGMARRTLLHSFDWRILAECQRQAPDLPTSFLTQLPDNNDEVGEDSAKAISPDFAGRHDRIPDLVHEAGGALWCPFVFDVTAPAVARARELGLAVAVWTVNAPVDIDRMIDLSVDAIVSDYPGRVQRRLADRGLRWHDDCNPAVSAVRQHV